MATVDGRVGELRRIAADRKANAVSVSILSAASETLEMIRYYDQLRAERDVLLADVAHMQERSFAVNEEFAALRAERDALRAAWNNLRLQLETTVSQFGDVSELRPDRYERWKAYSNVLDEMGDIAAGLGIAALAQTDTRP